MDNKEADKLKKTRGKWGEDKALKYLQSRGYTLIERNFRCKTGEIDLIMRGYGHICFVEVKTRSRTDYGLPCQAVDYRKQRRLKLSANLYLKTHPWLNKLSPRMDIVEVLITDGKGYIRHLPNAFS